jgi:hypothetical protein
MGDSRCVPRVEAAQPHVLDEALGALFDADGAVAVGRLTEAEAAAVFVLVWVATEALSEAWGQR